MLTFLHQLPFKKALAWVTIALVSACVTPYEADFKQQPENVVVQGFVSNQPGPYTIQLVRPANYSFAGYSIGIQGAKVYITDDTGGREDLVETSAGGQYKTQKLQGVVGRTYQLHFEVDGKNYESRPELLRDAGTIERIYHEPFQSINPITQERQLGGWHVYIDTQDPAERGNYYRWNSVRYKKLVGCGSAKDRYGNPIYFLFCCSDCWDIERCLGPDCINVANDALNNGQKIARQEVATVPVECRDQYYLEVEQQALSRDAYLYWKTIKQLLQNTGGVFDVAPSAVPSNLICISNPQEQVLGFFSAVGITRVGHVVDRRDAERASCPAGLPYPPTGGIPPPCTPCEESLYRTGQKPRFWDF
ncbi:DUF4249 domain-containing protein [Salmonirosea aquatica]|uniref:DUF4249 domain-containing protein n=1 Tax=Salmonirosea aquatica TaxID=2654236 RepID=UPI00128DE8AA